MTKTEYIMNLAVGRNGRNMSMLELADSLNRANYKTSYGEAYKGKRGTYTLVNATYKHLVAQGKQEEADIVATTFTNPSGGLAFQKN